MPWRPSSQFLSIAVELVTLQEAHGPGGMAGNQRHPGGQHPQPPGIAAAEQGVDGDQHQKREQGDDDVQAHQAAPSQALFRFQMHGHRRHRGTLPCLRHGFSSFLFSRVASALQTRRRVPCGMITSSMKPRLAATNGLANFSRYSSVRLAILAASPMSERKMISTAPLAPMTAISAPGQA